MRRMRNLGSLYNLCRLSLWVFDAEETSYDQYAHLQNRADTRAEEISLLAHELAQPLTVINSYLSGCIYRLQEKTIADDELILVLNSIKNHSALISAKIDELKNTLNKSDPQQHKVMNNAIRESNRLPTYELGYFNEL